MIFGRLLASVPDIEQQNGEEHDCHNYYEKYFIPRFYFIVQNATVFSAYDSNFTNATLAATTTRWAQISEY